MNKRVKYGSGSYLEYAYPKLYTFNIYRCSFVLFTVLINQRNVGRFYVKIDYIYASKLSTGYNMNDILINYLIANNSFVGCDNIKSRNLPYMLEKVLKKEGLL